MWTPEHRRAADRRDLRYPSDLTGAEWALAEPLIRPARRGGRPREVNVREVLNAIFYVLWTGCQWSALPKDLPPKSTAHYYFMLWDWDGTLERIHHGLYVVVRDREGREASSSAAMIDCQSAKGAQKGGFARPAGLRCGQEGHGAQAPHPRRYARPALERHCPSRRSAGPRRCPRAASYGAPVVSLHRDHLRRRRLSGAEDGGDRRRDRPLEAGDRQAHRRAPLRGPAEAVDRGENLRLDQPQPAPRPRLRALCQNRRRLRPPRHDPHHAQALDTAKSLLMNLNLLV